MSSESWFIIKYRDKTHRKFEIEIEKGNYITDYYIIQVYISCINMTNVQRIAFALLFSTRWIRINYKNDEFIKGLGTDNNSLLVSNLIKELLESNNIENLDQKEIIINENSDYADRIFRNEKGIFNIELPSMVVAKHNRFAREILLKDLYFLQSSRGPSSTNMLFDKCNYFRINLSNAVNALIDRKYIKRHSEKKTLELTYSGFSFVEEKLLSPFNNKIFLIAACNPTMYELIDKVYNKSVDELGLKLIFQEQDEPKESIHDDIWTYIADCKLIICDLSFNRPNCFIEYGYALAKDKQIILTINENEGKTETGFLTVPFDTLNQKYSFWKEEWLSNSDSEIDLLNFKDEIKQRLEMKLSILDIESEL
ncbi:MAG: hypothetical protein GF353_04960 [Candidatus Lokiarchaeota archaeon]|nr:hypothetical protein [Candidatus Lokiarchaeota archaeon]